MAQKNRTTKKSQKSLSLENAKLIADKLLVGEIPFRKCADLFNVNEEVQDYVWDNQSTLGDKLIPRLQSTLSEDEFYKFRIWSFDFEVYRALFFVFQALKLTRISLWFLSHQMRVAEIIKKELGSDSKFWMKSLRRQRMQHRKGVQMIVGGSILVIGSILVVLALKFFYLW